MKKKIFLNLTNGIERLNSEFINYDELSFIRIQSTHLEQKNYENIFLTLDSNFLMHLAMGFKCVVYDYGSRRSDGVSRSCWQGLELIRYACNKYWFDLIQITEEEFVKKQYNNFEHCYRNCKSIQRKLEYFKNFTNPELKESGIKLEWISEKTDNDGNMSYYQNVIKNYIGI